MKLRLARTAARQLDQVLADRVLADRVLADRVLADRVLADIAHHSPSGARNVQHRTRAVMHLLLQYPFAGQATARTGIRRMVVTPYPYVLTYRIGVGEVVIRTERHGARKSLA